jgi:hypothetical protein
MVVNTYLFVNNTVQSGTINNSIPTSSSSNYIVITNGSSPPPAWTPLSLGSALKLWLRSDLGITLANTNQVTAWADQSGNGGPTLTQTAGLTCPTYNTTDATYNNMPSLSISNTDSQGLQQLTAWPSPLAQPYTLIAIGNGTQGFSVQSLIGDDEANNFIVAAGYQNTHIDTSSIVGTINVAGTDVSNPNIFINCFNGATSTLAVSTLTPQTTGDIGETSASNRLDIGFSDGGQTAFLKGKVVEVLAIEGVLSGSNLSSFLSYASALWNISVGG